VALTVRERLEQLRHDHPLLHGLDAAVEVAAPVDDAARAAVAVFVLDGRGDDRTPGLQRFQDVLGGQLGVGRDLVDRR
jgi:hypothetical protein